MYEFKDNELKKVKYDSNTLRYMIFNENYNRVRFPSDPFFNELKNEWVLYKRNEEADLIEKIAECFDYSKLKNEKDKMRISQKIRITIQPEFSKELREKIKERSK